MTVGSLFSGIEGFGFGFEQAGFEVKWQVEKEPFCIAVLKTRFPNVERYYEIKDCEHGRKHKLGTVDVVTAGFPCQDLSVAGKRAGLAGARSGLFWEAIRIVGELRPQWLVLENVPGLFSSNEGRDFATVLMELGKLGCFRSIAWTVLDSQYFRVAQRRRRVFIVCGAGVGSAEQVLFEPESGEGDFTEGREEREGVAREVAGCLGSIGNGGFSANCEKAADGYLQVTPSFTSNGDQQKGFRNGEGLVATALSASAGHHGHSSRRGDGSDNLIAHPITASYGKQIDSSDRNGGPPNIICGGFNLQAGASAGGIGWRENGSPTLRGNTGGNKTSVLCAPLDSNGVRDFAELPEGLDSARYRALGNAVTANVAKWIAERIKQVTEERKTT